MGYNLKFFKKLIFITILLSVQVFLIYVYYKNEDLLMYFHSDYIKKAYLPAYLYRIEKSALFKNKSGASNTQASIIHEKSVPVLLYHGIVEKPDGYNTLIDNFRKEMFALKSAGYQTIALEDFYKFSKGEKKLPEKSFLLTFDDGRKDSYYPVDPILKALDYNAAMFVITRYINEKAGHFYLSKEELKNMADSGRWELEAHTQNGHDMVTIGPNNRRGHFYSNKLWRSGKGLETNREFQERIFNDLVGARNDLENNFGKRPTAFAFPFGDYGQDSININLLQSKEKILSIIRYTYPLSFYQVTPGNGYTQNYFGDDDYLFKRINVRPEWTPDDLLAVIGAGNAKGLPFEDDFSQFNSWLTSDGNNEYKEGMFLLKAPLDSSSAISFLEGSKYWTDYTFSARVDWNKGNKIGIIARYTFDSNYLACEVSGNSAEIVSVYDGKEEVLNQGVIADNYPKKDLELKLKVEKNNVACLVNNQLAVASDKIRKEQLKGGAGFKIGDNNVGNAEMAVKNVSITDNHSITDK